MFNTNKLIPEDIARFNFECKANIRDKKTGKVWPQYEDEIKPIKGVDVPFKETKDTKEDKETKSNKSKESK